MARKAFNEIIEGKLYQRGQILSWPRRDKVRFIKQNKIGIVVNFWTKLDSDLTDGVVQYMHLPSSSKDMLSFRMRTIAKALALILNKTDCRILVLCEAGKTRSVFFCVLILRYFLDIKLHAAYDRVVKKIPGHKMKDFMREHCYGDDN